jgi:hypothetical protein
MGAMVKIDVVSKTKAYIQFGEIEFDIKSDSRLYVELNGNIYYIDDSTNEQILEVFHSVSINDLL